MFTQTDELLIDQQGAILLLTLNRPHALNAWTTTLESAYLSTLAAADQDPTVRVIVVTGTGRAFCAGTDLSTPASEMAAAGPPLPERRASWHPPVMATPLIAAVNGACAGVGLAIALHADVRFVAEEAKLTTAFARRGLVGEHGVAWHLQRLVGRGRALDLLLSGRVFSGVEAGSFGLAEFVQPSTQTLSAAMAYAADVAANCSPRAMAMMKEQLWQDEHLTPIAALEVSDQRVHESFTWPDIVEGIASWQERRPPDFPGYTPSLG